MDGIPGTPGKQRNGEAHGQDHLTEAQPSSASRIQVGALRGEEGAAANGTEDQSAEPPIKQVG